MIAIYLDNNATTRTDPRVLDRVREVSEQCYGNPGSQHSVGRRARQILEDSREQIAELLNATPEGVVFTSGATEASNLALYGLARGRGVVATTRGEHPATEEVIGDLVAHGWKRQSLSIDENGLLKRFEFVDSVRLATLIYAHNETGVVQDVSRMRDQCEQHRIPWHLDATQAVGKLSVDFAALGCTAMSFAAHKFHGPRGVGCLVTRAGVTLPGRNLGGYQEGGRRAGTEPVALAAGMATALSIAIEALAERAARVGTLRDRFEQVVRDGIANAVVHGRAADRLPNTSCIGFPGCDGHALLVALDLAGVCCSLGSACASGSPEPAPVLLAMGVDESLARGSLRFSLSALTTDDEIRIAGERIVEAVRRQQHLA